MRSILVLKCSPRAGGVSDALADYFLAGAGELPSRVIALRENKIVPCQNCGFCSQHVLQCPLDGSDDCREIYDAFLSSALVVIASPIYFYALPAHFKAFIDRGQRFWAAREIMPRRNSVLVLMSAGRPRGEKLFEGALRCLGWFLKPLNAQIAAKLCYRGLDSPADLAKRPQIGQEIRAFAQNEAPLLASGDE